MDENLRRAWLSAVDPDDIDEHMREVVLRDGEASVDLCPGAWRSP
jgi:hypothetical protein